jgi:ATP-dependent helicase Lhr and Lhr-like helicase
VTEEPSEGAARTLTRSVGASVVLRNGELVAYLRRNNPNLQVFLPTEEPDRSNTARDLSHYLAVIARQEAERREDHRGGLLISTVNGQTAGASFLARFLQDAGFQPAPLGFNLRRAVLPPEAAGPLSSEIQ